MSTAVVIKAPAGLGKTTQILTQLAKSNDKAEYYAPTHDLAEEVRAKLQKLNPSRRVTVIGGRSHKDLNGKPLCKKHLLAEALARNGGEVYSSLCAKERLRNGHPITEKCRYYGNCAYIAQFKPADVTIYTHAYLPLHRMKLEPPVPDIAVIDESFYNSCIETFQMSASLLRAAWLDPLTALICRQIEHALAQGLPLYEHLESVGVDFYNCIAAKRAIGRNTGIHPMMREAQQRAAVPRLRERSLLRKLLGTVVTEYQAQRTESQGLAYCPERRVITVHVKKPIVRFHKRTFGAPGKASRVLVIDASADERIIKQWFSKVETERIPAPRNAKVVQVASTRCSTTSLVPKKNGDPTSKKAARKRLHQIETFVAQISNQHAKVLVVGPQAITGNPKEKVKPIIRVPANVELAHFQAIRGIDKWKDCSAVIVVGRNEPPIAVAEGIARCVFLSDRTPLVTATEWKMQVRGYRRKSGQRGVTVVTHPDPRVQAVLEQIREEESQQAIDRIRLVHSGVRKAVYILSNIPLNVDVDELVSWDHLMEGLRLEQAWGSLPGVMPIQPEWLAKRFPRLWKSANAAKADVRRWRKECRFTNSTHISNLTLFEHQYRAVQGLGGGGGGQKAWSVFLSCDQDPARARAALEGLLGFPVEFRVAAARKATGRVSRLCLPPTPVLEAARPGASPAV